MRGEIALELNVSVTGGYINKNTSSNEHVSLSFSSSGCEQAPSGGADEVINGHSLSRLVAILLQVPDLVPDEDILGRGLGPDGLLTVLACCTHGWVPQPGCCSVATAGFLGMCQHSGAHECLDAATVEVAQLGMPFH